MRLDHIAYRTADRRKTAEFFIKAFNYRIQEEFEINFEDGTKARCIALEPPERVPDTPWTTTYFGSGINETEGLVDYHAPPEIFVSDGDPESIVGKWVADRDGVGGVHHMAYQVESVKDTVSLWKSKGYAEFLSPDPLQCPGLTQIFTKPSELTGVIYEFIERGSRGFCKDNVKSLMESTESISRGNNGNS